MRQGNSLRGYIRQAVKRGRAMGMQLDFSEASVQALEGMLENLHREMALPSGRSKSERGADLRVLSGGGHAARRAGRQGICLGFDGGQSPF